MKVKVLRSFNFSRDGIHAIPAVVGETIADFPDDIAAGCIAEGYIKESGGAKHPVDDKPVDIPADWEALKPKNLMKLAKALGATPADKAAAVAAVKAEIEKRAAAAQGEPENDTGEEDGSGGEENGPPA